MEFDLARFRGVEDSARFVAILDRIVDEMLTDDFWSIPLPNDLATSAARSPSLFGYLAALNVLDARVLFSDRKVSELLDPAVSAGKSVDRHHLFPKAYLKSIGVGDRRDQNQIANQAFLEWGDNVSIGGKSPGEYMPQLRERIPPAELERMYYFHALPDGWETMEYPAFLEARRTRIAIVIKEAYKALSTQSLTNGNVSQKLYDLVQNGEGSDLEFKSTLRTNLHTREKDPIMEFSCLKTISGFLNSTKGGTLLIGVADDGGPIGILEDGFTNEDKMSLHLINLIKSRIGEKFMMYIHPRFEDYRGERVLSVEIKPSRSPAFLIDGNEKRFFVRAGPSSAQLKGDESHQYISQRFD